MNDYDRIKNFNDLKYGIYEIFNNFWPINFDEDQNIKKTRTLVKIKSFLLWGGTS
jgi:hypothetical protein